MIDWVAAAAGQLHQAELQFRMLSNCCCALDDGSSQLSIVKAVLYRTFFTWHYLESRRRSQAITDYMAVQYAEAHTVVQGMYCDIF
eukprot:2709-Heterococcus_DN1.PRE.1